MKNIKWPLQFLATLLVSTFLSNNIIKVVFLILFWVLSFRPLNRKELLFFLITNIVFVFSNFGALMNSTFSFTEKDILLMPYNELLMWGFYCLNAHRFIGIHRNQEMSQWKLLTYAILFAASFSLVHDEIRLMLLLVGIFVIALLNFRSKRDLTYVGYFLFMGAVVESLGVHFNLWHYPHARFFEFPLWAPLMWMNIGLIMSQVAIWFFRDTSRS